MLRRWESSKESCRVLFGVATEESCGTVCFLGYFFLLVYFVESQVFGDFVMLIIDLDPINTCKTEV